MRTGKNPFIGSSLKEILASLEVQNFKYKESILLRQGDEDLKILKEAAGNLVGIFSRYPNSEVLVNECRNQIEKANSQSWFKEKYCYAYKDL